MSDTATKSKTSALLSDIYKNVKMASDSIIDLLPSVKDDGFKTAITEQLGKYEEFAATSEQLLKEEGEEAKGESVFTKLSAKMGTKMNTMIDNTTSHLAEMMIEGATMGVTDMTKAVRKFENESCSEKSLSLAKEVLAFEENTIETLKKFL